MPGSASAIQFRETLQNPLALTGINSVITSMKQILVLDHKVRFVLKIMTNMLSYIAEGIL